MLESALWRCGTSGTLKVRLAEFWRLCTTLSCSVKMSLPKKTGGKKHLHGAKWKLEQKKHHQPRLYSPFTVDSCMLMCYGFAGWDWLWFMSSASTHWETWRLGCVLISMQSNVFFRDSRHLQRLQFSFSLYGRVLPVGRPDVVERSNLGYE